MGKAKRIHHRPPAHLLTWRKILGLTRPEVARLIELLQPDVRPPLDQATIARWESGETAVRLQDLELLAKVYGTTPDRLLFDPGDKTTPGLMRRAHAVLTGVGEDRVDWWLSIGERILGQKK